MSMLENIARGASAAMIAQKASSFQAFDGGLIVPNVAPHNVRDYFRKYGSTVKKFEHLEQHDIYVGFVRMGEKREFLSFIVMEGRNAVAVSFDSEVDESNDLFTLMAKAEFVRDKLVAVRQAAAAMVAARIPPPSPPPPPPPPPPVPTSLPKKGSAWVPMFWVGLVVLFVVAVLVRSHLDNLSMLRAQGPEFDANDYQTPPPVDYGSDVLSQLAAQQAARDSAPAAAPAAKYTFGDMIDAVDGGVSDFARAYRSGGISAAQDASQRCYARISATNWMPDVDRCAGLDLAAQAVDEELRRSMGLPLNSYFATANARMRRAYEKFPDFSDSHLVLVMAQVTDALDAQSSDTPPN